MLGRGATLRLAEPFLGPDQRQRRVLVARHDAVEGQPGIRQQQVVPLDQPLPAFRAERQPPVMLAPDMRHHVAAGDIADVLQRDAGRDQFLHPPGCGFIHTAVLASTRCRWRRSASPPTRSTPVRTMRVAKGRSTTAPDRRSSITIPLTRLTRRVGRRHHGPPRPAEECADAGSLPHDSGTERNCTQTGLIRMAPLQQSCRPLSWLNCQQTEGNKAFAPVQPGSSWQRGIRRPRTDRQDRCDCDIVGCGDTGDRFPVVGQATCGGGVADGRAFAAWKKGCNRHRPHTAIENNPSALFVSVAPRATGQLIADGPRCFGRSERGISSRYGTGFAPGCADAQRTAATPVPRERKASRTALPKACWPMIAIPIRGLLWEMCGGKCVRASAVGRSCPRQPSPLGLNQWRPWLDPGTCRGGSCLRTDCAGRGTPATRGR